MGLATHINQMALGAVPAPSAAAAAQYYPAIYWYSMLKVPGEAAFSGPQRDKNMPANLTAQAQWVNIIKTTGCMSCHALGTIGTRTAPSPSSSANSRVPQKLGSAASSPGKP